MGGVWCRADRGPTSYSTKGPFTTISRWTNHVRQAYKKPKPNYRPPRPPQKPFRMNERLTISYPELNKEQSSDGWRTATLVVPQLTPIPPPRKKKRLRQQLTRVTSYSMDDLNSSVEEISTSTVSLPGQSVKDTTDAATLVVTPVLEVDHTLEKLSDKSDHIVEEVEDICDTEEIIPVQNGNLYLSRNIIHSNLGYVDKLSAISEVSAESGFDDRPDDEKYSETSSGSVVSNDRIKRGVEETVGSDVRGRTALSKKEWLENILKQETDVYSSPEQTNKGYLDRTNVVFGEPISSGTDHLHLMNLGTNTSAPDNTANKTPPSSPSGDRSLLSGSLLANSGNTSDTREHEGTCIFLTNTRTNIIYKSHSSDNLTHEYATDVTTNPFVETKHDNNVIITTTNHNKSNDNPFVINYYGTEEINEKKNPKLIVKEINPTDINSCNIISINGIKPEKQNAITINIEESAKQTSTTSSRRSSMTESLHEFEMSIYDMLKESKYKESSDEEESLKTIKLATRN